MLRGQVNPGQARRGDRRSAGQPAADGAKAPQNGNTPQAGQDQATVMFSAAELEASSAPADAAVAAEPADVPPSDAAPPPDLPLAAEQQPPPAAQPAAAASGSDAAADAPAAEAEPPPQPFALVRKVALAGGMLHLVCLEGSRMLRVWMPPGVLKTGWGAGG
jgi:hypothetical protein